MEEETEKSKHGNPAVTVVLCIGLVLALYIVSPIPVSFVLNHSQHHGSAPLPIRNIYSPFAWAREHTVLNKPIDRYGKFLDKI